MGIHTPGLPDSVGPADLPGNSIAAEHRQMTDEQNMAEAVVAARAQLLNECYDKGDVQAAYFDCSDDEGGVSPAKFVADLERTDDELWRSRLDAALRDLAGDDQ